ncbi:MAG: hypothetical protein ACW99F_07615 [Candidatus Hodarchaeales archaeon]|jgi:hypothetical protein
MDFSELLFTSLGPLLYNFIFIVLWILWISYHYEEKEGRIHSYFRSYLNNNRIFYLITGVFISVFLFFLFSYINSHTDVDDAITSGVEAFLNGQNPYQEDVVLHELPSGPVLGRYHYFPPDLLTYSFFYVLTNGFFVSIFGTYWFFPLHIAFLLPGYWIVHKIILWPHQKLLPFFLLLVTPFLFTNSMLMWIFFLLGYYLYEKKDKKSLGMVFYVLAASVKYFVGIIIVFYFFRSLNRFLGKKLSDLTTRDLINEFSPYIWGSTVLALISIPFNLIDVIISVFFYQGDPSFRGAVAQSVGPVLIELLNIIQIETLYLPSLAIILILTLILIRNQSTYEKILHFSFLTMFILPFYGTELFITLPFYWWFKEAKDELVSKENEK